MANNEPRVLLFDIDGTLLNPAKEGRVCLSRALTEVFGTTGPIDDFPMAGKTDWQIVTELMTEAGLPADQIDTGREAAFDAYARAVAEAAPTLQMLLLPGVESLLAALSGEPDFALGLVTGNVRDSVPYKLRAVGIDPALFTFGAYGSERPHRNDLPGLAISRCEEQWGQPVDRAKVLVIGDTFRDIECARHAGVKVLTVATGHTSAAELAEHQPDYVLEDLTDTEAVLKILKTF
ncbi:MAG: HAD hydrolase-like protein [Anaerolineaceae bacterium]|nr:HAD hydrolase-like protein [Anaerolineaceae bacterium]